MFWSQKKNKSLCIKSYNERFERWLRKPWDVVELRGQPLEREGKGLEALGRPPRSGLGTGGLC